jgi:ankyrin repeat protein
MQSSGLESDHVDVAGNLTALMLAATNNHVETIKVLHELGADVNSRTNDESGNQAAVTMASFKGHTETVRALHELGADVNAKTSDGSGNLTSLMAAGARHARVCVDCPPCLQ